MSAMFLGSPLVTLGACLKFVKQLGHSIKMRTVGSKLSGIESFDARCKASLIIVLLTISLHVGQSAGTIHLTSGFQNHDNSLKRDPFHISFFKLLFLPTPNQNSLSFQ